MKADILITVLSWEDRYLRGLQKNLESYEVELIILFKYNNPLTEEWKKVNLSETVKLAGDRLKVIEIDPAIPHENWVIFKKIFAEYSRNKHALIDITTMTREAIYLSLYNCRIYNCSVDYVYYKPSEYAGDWISRDPGKPRLLYKMSGIAKLGAPTLLLVTSGYDFERLDSLIYCFEPYETVVFLANGEHFKNKDHSERCENKLRVKYKIESFHHYDPYDVDASCKQILEILTKPLNEAGDSYLSSYNIIFNSLGAKPSAISLFKIWLDYPNVALSYIPSKEYNRQYSKGIGDSIAGKIPNKLELNM